MSYTQQLEPLDEANQRLQSNVHPTDWINPKPSGRYHLVVVGAGTAGLVSAAGAAGLGAKVALVERGLMGGDCLNVGCVPSKAVISAARRAAAVRDAGDFGVQVAGSQVDFAEVMQRMRNLRASISPNDSARRFTEMGIDVFMGQGTFTGDHTLDVDGEQLEFKRAVIATGARAAELPIPGLNEVEYLTNENIFSLTQIPSRLVVIGGGPIGCEMAQAFARLGSQVTQVEQGEHILARESHEAARIVQAALQRDGVTIELNARVVRVEQQGAIKRVLFQRDEDESEIETDAILVSIGRAPNVDGLGLDTIGVKHDARLGVEVDDRLRTTNPSIYAAGDVCSKFQFTHAADFQARIVIQNSLFLGRAKASDLLIPWCTYTSPELAHVGIQPAEAAEQGIELSTYTQKLSEVDRAILDGQTEGMVQVYCQRGKDRILGATIVAEHAGDLISQLTLAMQQKIGLGKIAPVIHPYPTQAEAIRKLGDQYNRTRLTPFVKRLMRTWLKWVN